MKKFFNLAKRVKSAPNGAQGGASRRLSVGSTSSKSLVIHVVRGGYNIDLAKVDATFSKLHKGVLLNYDEAKIRKYLKQGIDPNQVDNVTRSSPLHLAVVNNNLVLIKALLENSANINLRDGEGKTPLVKAIECQQQELVQYFLYNDCDTNIPDTDYGNSALHWALSTCYVIGAQILLRPSSNVDVNRRNRLNETPLHLAAKYSELTSVLDEMIIKKAMVDAKDDRGKTPLMVASSNGNKSGVEALLGHGANINLCDVNGDTPLELANKSGFKDIVAIFQERSAEGRVGPWSDSDDSSIMSDTEKKKPAVKAFNPVIEQLQKLQGLKKKAVPDEGPKGRKSIDHPVTESIGETLVQDFKAESHGKASPSGLSAAGSDRPESGESEKPVIRLQWSSSDDEDEDGVDPTRVLQKPRKYETDPLLTPQNVSTSPSPDGTFGRKETMKEKEEVWSSNPMSPKRSPTKPVSMDHLDKVLGDDVGNDDFIRQIKDLLDEEIQYNDDLDALLMPEMYAPPPPPPPPPPPTAASAAASPQHETPPHAGQRPGSRKSSIMSIGGEERNAPKLPPVKSLTRQPIINFSFEQEEEAAPISREIAVTPKTELTVQPKVDPIAQPKVQTKVKPPDEPKVQPRVEHIDQPKVESKAEPKREINIKPTIETQTKPEVKLEKNSLTKAATEITDKQKEEEEWHEMQSHAADEAVKRSNEAQEKMKQMEETHRVKQAEMEKKMEMMETKQRNEMEANFKEINELLEKERRERTAIETELKSLKETSAKVRQELDESFREKMELEKKCVKWETEVNRVELEKRFLEKGMESIKKDKQRLEDGEEAMRREVVLNREEKDKALMEKVKLEEEIKVLNKQLFEIKLNPSPTKSTSSQETTDWLTKIRELNDRNGELFKECDGLRRELLLKQGEINEERMEFKEKMLEMEKEKESKRMENEWLKKQMIQLEQSLAMDSKATEDKSDERQRHEQLLLLEEDRRRQTMLTQSMNDLNSVINRLEEKTSDLSLEKQEEFLKRTIIESAQKQIDGRIEEVFDTTRRLLDQIRSELISFKDVIESSRETNEANEPHPGQDREYDGREDHANHVNSCAPFESRFSELKASIERLEDNLQNQELQLLIRSREDYGVNYSPLLPANGGHFFANYLAQIPPDKRPRSVFVQTLLKLQSRAAFDPNGQGIGNLTNSEGAMNGNNGAISSFHSAKCHLHQQISQLKSELGLFTGNFNLESIQ